MKIPHSPEGKWPVIKNPKLKGLHITTCGLCNKGNSNWYFRTAFSCSDYQTILFFFSFLFNNDAFTFQFLQDLKQQRSVQWVCVSSTNQSHSIWDRKLIIFRQGLLSCFRIWVCFVFWSPGTFMYLGSWLLKFLHCFFIIFFHFQHQFWRFPVQCSDFAAQPSPAEQLAEELPAGTSTTGQEGTIYWDISDISCKKMSSWMSHSNWMLPRSHFSLLLSIFLPVFFTMPEGFFARLIFSSVSLYT